uniref:DUF4283 domain-containing protein n=1 Tax=Tanacetum cinerariifolium TaxID=118510 RepID=A0A699GMF3_TANCI|nr:hypothetical protein [Tanacetum cinerariifolium]
MERGFLDSGDQKKKKKDGDGVKKDAMYEAANIGIAAKVKLIDGKLRKPMRGTPITIDVPAMGSIKGRGSHLEKLHTYVGGPPTKSILKKAVDNEKGEASNGGKHTPTKVRFRPITTSTVVVPVDSEGSYNGGTCEAKTDCSFASLVGPKESSSKVHFHAFVNDEKLESFDCVLPKAVASKVKSRYENFIVGFFLGKDLSFPMVQQYVSNTWQKFRFEKITRNDDGVYLFKFASKSGMDQVLEKGSWLIRKSPIILNKWTPSVSLKKGEVANVPIWVKMYNVSALIEVSASSALKKEVIMAVPEDEGDGYVKEVIRVEYEWKPPHCVDCQSFGHDSKLCPKRVREEVPKNSDRDTKATTMEENDDGFTEVKSRKKKKGVDFGVDAKPNSTSPSASSNDVGNDKGVSNLGLNTSNPFDVLNVDGDAMGEPKTQPKVSEYVSSDLNENRLGASKPGSSKSVYGDGHKDKNISSPSVMKKWDVINEDDTTDDEDVFNSYDGSLGGGNQLEDEDFDLYEGYAD